MVNIHHHEPMAPVADAPALELFEQQWSVYQKFLDNDYGSSVGAYRALHRLLNDSFSGPFAFLDLACGDARGSVSALHGTAVAHYHGVDLAPPALEIAARNLEALDCEIELEHGDFTEAINMRPEPADVVWMGLSLHHLIQPQKLELMRAIRKMIGPDGQFIAYEPTLINGENRAAYLDRCEAITRSEFSAYAPDEIAALMAHVRSSDFPESMDDWNQLGRGAGFARTEHVFSAAPDLYRMFRFSG